MSSLLMVLLLLTLGSLLLEGLNLQQRPLQEPLACRTEPQQGWHTCLRIFGDGSLLLSSASGEVQVWQSGEVRGGQVYFFAHGWSDFCPLREVSLCQMP